MIECSRIKRASARSGESEHARVDDSETYSGTILWPAQNYSQRASARFGDSGQELAARRHTCGSRIDDHETRQFNAITEFLLVLRDVDCMCDATPSVTCHHHDLVITLCNAFWQCRRKRSDHALHPCRGRMTLGFILRASRAHCVDLGGEGGRHLSQHK